MKQAYVATGMVALMSAAALAIDPQPKGGDMQQPGDINITSPDAQKSLQSIPVSGASKEIQAYLTKFTNETIKATDPMARCTDMLSKADRERIHSQLQKDYPDLQKTIADFRQAWKDKYHSGFDMGSSDTEVAFAGSRVLEGDVSDQAILASQQLGPSVEPKRDALEQMDKESKKVDQKVTGEKRLATVILPAAKEQQLDAVTLRVVDEGTLLTDWRVNCPDTLTAQKLHDNLSGRLSSLLQHKDQWPAESRDAYRIVSHQILAALTDQPVQSPTPMMDGRRTGLDVED